MNLKKINSVRFSKLFNCNNNLFQIKYVGNSIDSGRLSVYNLNSNDRTVMSSKTFLINDFKSQNVVYTYLQFKLNNSNDFNKIKKYISQKLNIY